MRVTLIVNAIENNSHFGSNCISAVMYACAFPLAARRQSLHPRGMDLDTLLHHYFDTTELDTLDEGALERGIERLGTAFGLEKEPGRRFALWSLLHTLGDAPDPAVAFKDPRERHAAETYARATSRATEN